LGGTGSGRQSSLGFLTGTTNDYKSIDLAWLRREKLLEVGCQTTITWSRNRTKTGSVGLTILSGGIRLVYRTRCSGGDWEDINDFIRFVWTATQFGGERRWFQCPSCEQRCRIIYGGSYFRCRRCFGLRYETQYEPGFARAATAALKVRDRLGSRGGIDEPFPPKPKGMHWKTYERLLRKDEELLRQWGMGIKSRWSRYG
jgi:hypothetical protein